jgi:zinc/manganese transport system substrate-binding protein
MILEKRRVRHRVMVSAVVLVLGSFALAGCGSGPSTPGLVQVVGAEVQYGDVLAQIGGPYVHVTSVMSNPNTDPHNFEASPSVAQAIASAQLIVQNGAGYDTFMNQLESASASSARVVLSIAVLRDQVSAINPHFWYSPSTMPTLARVVASDLATIAPAHAAYFHAREVKFLNSWRPVTLALASARRRFSQRPVATTEPVGDYLLSAMGLLNLTPFRFQADVMNGIDPSPEDIVAQQSLLNRHRVGALCFNAQVSSPVTSALRNLAAKDKVPLVALYETMPAGQHVQGWMHEEIDAIEAALANGVSTVSFA